MEERASSADSNISYQKTVFAAMFLASMAISNQPIIIQSLISAGDLDIAVQN